MHTVVVPHVSLLATLQPLHIDTEHRCTEATGAAVGETVDHRHWRHEHAAVLVDDITMLIEVPEASDESLSLLLALLVTLLDLTLSSCYKQVFGFSIECKGVVHLVVGMLRVHLLQLLIDVELLTVHEGHHVVCYG